MIPLIDLTRQYDEVDTEIDKAVVNVIRSGKYIMSDQVRDFEEAFSSYLGVKYAVSVGNGTDALVIGLQALGIGEGDEVIVPSFTFFASAEAVAVVGAKPVFCDVLEDTYDIDPEKIEDLITENTKAIIPVHIFGNPCEMKEIRQIAKKHGLYVIEDAAQAAGAEYAGRKCGSMSDIACFSFFPTKNLGCAGDGGMIVTDSYDLATIARALRAHGSGENGRKAYELINDTKEDEELEEGDNTTYNSAKYHNYLIGHNSRLDEVQAAILNVKLPYLDNWNEERAFIADSYTDGLEGTDFVCPSHRKYSKMIYHMYILQTDERERILSHLKDRGIGTGVYYPIPLHLQKAFSYLGYKEGDLPVSEYLSKRTLAIPMFPGMKNKEIEEVLKALREL